MATDSTPNELTHEWHGGEKSATLHTAPDESPQKIGRYHIEKVLGRGGFGVVYLGHDEQLNRPVAIKVPHARLVSRAEDAQAYLAEARAVANLDHPNVVPVYDVGSAEDFPCYVISKYVAGRDLATAINQARLSIYDATHLVATVAEALHYAHRRGLVHRDVKPSNILLDSGGKPFIVDFGLALLEENSGKGPKYVGTPRYMSPEQARGEGHRVDGRSDIFSLGVVFYELLTGRRPFRANTRAQLLEQITTFDPRPIRQISDSVPPELERICFKALSKRASERYMTAQDMANDLRHYQAESAARQQLVHGSVTDGAPATTTISPSVSPATSSAASSALVTTSLAFSNDTPPVKIVPKGLRCFDAHDADFFLELLPGPRDRDGLPESIRFWKTRIDETDSDNTFPVGLMYGPSGCGKSSLVRAGLLPRISDSVIAVYLEATANETETRLLNGLRRRCPDVPGTLDLKQTVAALRRRQSTPRGNKVLIILDQFEQWLHARNGEENTELVQALRQCDGARVQCIVMVRDDFWMMATRFMRELEFRLHEGQNSAPVDLFDADHARKVLAALGRASGRLPDGGREVTKDQREFLKQAVSGLVHNGKVICVHLALFAEMMKSKPWTPATLREVGGTAGVGVTFLEETFSAATAPPAHHFHQKAARDVLKALLPDSGTDIKGHMRSYDELLASSGYANRTSDFDDLIRILDGEIRLITPTDPESVESEDIPASAAKPGRKFYQLTHDYLVQSLRDWLSRKRRESWRGRAELRLEERTGQWTRSRESRFLPNPLEYVTIVAGVPRNKRKPAEQAMMRSAGRYHGVRWGAVLAVLLVSGSLLQQYVRSVRQITQQQRAETLVEAVVRASAAGVPYAIENVQPMQTLSVPLLRTRLQDESAEPNHRLHAAMGLAALGEVHQDFLLESLRVAPAEECRNILRALGVVKDEAVAKLVDLANLETDRDLKTRYASALLFLGEPAVARQVLALDSDPTYRTTFIHGFQVWHGSDFALISADLLRKVDDPAFRSGVCVALGLIPPDSFTSSERETLQTTLQELYTDVSDGATHSAAGWLLRKWKAGLPVIKSSDQVLPGRHWFLNRHDMTMLEVRPGSFEMGDADTAAYLAQPPHKVTLTRPFFICDREVWVDLFQQFVDDLEYPTDEKPKDRAEHWDMNRNYSPTGDCAAQSVSWFDAVLFCNWLSLKEGRQPCYRRTGEKQKFRAGDEDQEWEVWNCDFDRSGYRLPTEAEWEYACRAGTTSMFTFGDDRELLMSYAIFTPNAKSRAWPVGERLPNGWGLFDMHGNLWEWCWDWHAPYSGESVTDPVGPDQGQGHIIRGGGWDSNSGNCRSAGRGIGQPSDYYKTIGFRVVLSCGADQHSKRTP